MPQFTQEQVLKALDEVVAERGAGYVVPVLGQYTVHPGDERETGMNEGAPLCIVGAVVDKLDPTGKTIGLLHKIEITPGYCPLDYTVGELFSSGNYEIPEEEWMVDLSGEEYAHFGDMFDAKTLEALSVAQAEQDKSQKWGIAREEAHQRLERA